MRCPAVWLVCVLLLCWSAPVPVSAGTPGGDGWRTITSPQGYAFQVPSDWEQIPPNSTLRILLSVSCANPTFCVAVGEGCTILTSHDGHAWALQSGGTCPELDGVACVSPSFCVAVGEAGAILTSSDGHSWTPHPGVTRESLSGVSCASPAFCAAVGGSIVGGPGVILTTTDGSTWSPHPGITDETLFGVSCVMPSFCVAVGHNNTIVTSSDGNSWTVQQTGPAPGLTGLPGLGPILTSVSCAGPSFCVAVGDKGTILTSSDGYTWTSHSSGGANLSSVSCPSAGFCVAVEPGGTILTSRDAFTWVPHTWAPRPAHTVSALESVFCAGPSFCVAAGFGGTVVTSDDGSTWTGITEAGGWRQIPASGTPVGFARQAQSPDGNELVFAGAAPVSQADSADPARLARAIFGDTSSVLLELGTSAPAVLQRPEAVQVANADTAVVFTESATDAQGNSSVLGVRVATQGTTAFEFALFVPEEFSTSDPSFGRILDSFQLTQSSPNLPASAPERPPAGNELITVMSPQGYALQVPSDWSQDASDGAYQSPDGDEMASVFAGPGLGTTPIDLSRFAEEFVNRWNAGLVLSRGGPANIFQGPDAVQIPNADAGVALTEVVADPLGDHFVAGFRIAIRDAEVYIVILLVPEDFYTSDPGFDRILDSFRLTQPPASAPPPSLLSTQSAGHLS
jgi:photosystem II stability/assembly factor-like uncharacterized protein